MSRFNTPTAQAITRSPIVTEQTPSGSTYEGAPGYARGDAKSELFLLAVSNFVSTDAFYETGQQRDTRFEQLVHQVAVQDIQWLSRFLPWLRGQANMRTAALVAAAEAVRAQLAEVGQLHHSVTGHNRKLIAAVCQRADEPGELLAYWTSRYGRALPKPVKRGLADAVARLYTERALLKYDTDAKGYRFGDVIDLVHPAPAPERAAWQGELFRYALDRRHNRGNPIPEALRILRRNQEIMRIPVRERRDYLRSLMRSGLEAPSHALREAGVTWEQVAGWLQGPMDAVAWEAVIPAMGTFALVRNLRNFDEAGVSDTVAERAAAAISDPEAVARSRMFPFRFWAAYKHVASLRWGHALEKALAASLANIPALPGRTLILVDRSPSMFPGYHFSTPNKSDIPLAEQAAVFGAALALRAASPTLVEFGGANRQVPVPRGGSVLRLIEGFGQFDGTDIPSAVRAHYAGHDRLVIITDEQTRPGYLPSNMHGHGGMPATAATALIPERVPVYMWNFAGYQHGAAPSGSGRHHTFGGLTDQAFAMIPLLECGRDGAWPF